MCINSLRISQRWYPLFHHEDIDDEKTKEEINKIATELEKVNAKIGERKQIYENAFEWRYMFPDVLADDGSFVGFDCIIGNPPYIQLQKMGGVVDEYEKKGYNSFARTGDISVLFYEWCMSLLRKGGYLTFITTNSWMRADYGRKLQKFFEGSDVNPMLLIDFFTFQVFRDVTVRTNILMLQKAENQNRLMCCTVEDNKTFKLKDLGTFYEKNKRYYSFAGRASWVFLTEDKEAFIDSVRKQGVPLSEWNLNINRGILSGCDDAFWISSEQYKKIVSADEHCKEILVPHLRGRNIKQYQIEWEGYYLINTHIGFYLDTEKYYINAKAYMIVGKHLGYLTAFFNSAIFRYCFTDDFPIVQGDGRELRKSAFQRIPVKDVSDEEDAEYERRVMEIQQMKREGQSTEEKEHELDLMILAHYGIIEPEQQNKILSN